MSYAQRILAGLSEKSAEMDEDVGMEFMAVSKPSCLLVFHSEFISDISFFFDLVFCCEKCT